MAAARRSARALRLRVSLRDVEPEIWRTLLVRESASLARLHDAIQQAMGWIDSHLYQFKIGGQQFTDHDTWEPFDDADEPGDSQIAKLVDLERKEGSCFTYLYDFGTPGCTT